MIKFDSVSKAYPHGNFHLKDISFQIDTNEFVFFVGPSGAGKTTILKMILKAIIPTSGSIFVNDLEITDKKFNNIDKLRQQIGVVFQDFKIINDKNIFENVALSLKITQTAKKIIQDEVNKVLDMVGLEEKKFMFPIQLSAGELQRAAIARAIIGGRDIILADEPTGNLDPKTAWEIMRIFKKLDHEEKTIIIATHNVDIVNSFKKRVIALKEGIIKKDLRSAGYEL
ncbi:hypothetical protein A3C23_01875 [Candidatus Roizmanbacteria bacterium RIFCSPHIGHO2_02_FULL_37_13b]|uniref:ABC transporter domain-containing protein n=1 Tax=Candidatus Roizmanbacteria bacterium RIFCSPLOWO2_02_FULL_36_11 TaxID=1802071 RepID=A0A1F7JBL2_9BACT|nr:MAG: hypothetical protein A3C23_01875 [Candidatus Roizmanbacteria bacterium RIFCSPHIGHO2_02_FULL_37_13b]OGK53001.1 MAG: hypothetical protein A3H78_02195 [Candidatus Roizmanbacteria bacterium RIFCSPLOWO2_02_FULL_36_11]